MIKLFRNHSLFYLKSLALWGLLLAFLHCSAFQSEQHGVTQFKLADGDGNAVAGNAANNPNAEAVYPYPRLVNLIEQCRALESEYRKSIERFQKGECEISEMESLRDNVCKTTERLQQERVTFTEFVAANRENSQPVVYSKSGKRNRGMIEMLGKKNHNKEQKTHSYTAQVLQKKIQEMTDRSDRLSEVIQEAKSAASQAKERAAAEAAKIEQVSATQEESPKPVAEQKVEKLSDPSQQVSMVEPEAPEVLGLSLTYTGVSSKS